MEKDQAYRDLLKHLAAITRTAVALDSHDAVSFRTDKANTLRGLLMNDNLTKESAERVYLMSDGACRGNPGPAATASIVISRHTGRILSKVCRYIGNSTNNRTEFVAAANGLEKVVELGVRQVELLTDSELLVDAMNNRSSIKDQYLVTEMIRIQKATEQLDSFSATKVHRQENFMADMLANLVLDLRA